MCIESTALSNAPSMLEACRIELEKCGFAAQAATLRGVEIFNKYDALQAIAFLRGMSGITGSAKHARDDTIQVLVQVQ